MYSFESYLADGGYLRRMKDFTKAKYKTCALVIIDNMNVVAEKHPELLIMQQLTPPPAPSATVAPAAP